MSNNTSVAAVTATLARVLQDAGTSAVSGATVTLGRPEPSPGQSNPPRINLFLFQVTPNASWRNDDTPTRRQDGSPVARPQAALDLHYLISFYGEDADLVPERLLGSTVSVLHAQPILSPELIQATIDAELLSDPAHFLGGADLPEQRARVRIGPSPLDVEEITRLWSAFFQTPYALSIAYSASVVLVETDVAPQSALPVQARNLYVDVLRRPRVETVRSVDGPAAPILSGGDVAVTGTDLRGPVTTVRIGDVEITPADADLRANRIVFTLPADVQAGVRALQVIHDREMGTPPVLHRGQQSNAMAFAVRPDIGTIALTDTEEITVTMTPDIGRDQRVALLLNEFDAPTTRSPFAYTFPAPADNGITDPLVETTSEIVFETPGIETATYVARLQVDGVESPLTTDGSGRYDGPSVTVP